MLRPKKIPLLPVGRAKKLGNGGIYFYLFIFLFFLPVDTRLLFTEIILKNTNCLMSSVV